MSRKIGSKLLKNIVEHAQQKAKASIKNKNK